MLPPPSDIRNLEPGEVIGRTLVEIRQLWSMCPEEGFDFAWSYCLLDSGLTIALRFECIVAEKMPPDAEPIEHRSLNHVYRQIIESAWLASDDCGWGNAPYLVFRNGWVISDVAIAPRGVGGVGIEFFEPGELEFTKFRKLW